MTVNKLWTRYQQKRTNEYRNDLVIHYLPLAHLHASRFQKKVAKYLSTDEILGAASIGLIQAIEAFDPSRKLKFKTFSAYRICGAIVDWLRDLDVQSRTVRIFEKEKHKAVESLIHNGIHEATQIAEEMGISYGRYTYLSKLVSHGEQTLFSTLTDHSYSWDAEDKSNLDPARAINRSFLQEFISKELCRLDRMIIILYYFEGLTMREIGDMVDLSESRISQMKIQAIARIRWSLKGTIYECERLLLA